VPLARRQRRGQPWEARPAHAGLHPGHADQGSSNERRPVQRRASFSPEVVQLAATASRVPYGHRQKRSAALPPDSAATPTDLGACGGDGED